MILTGMDPRPFFYAMPAKTSLPSAKTSLPSAKLGLFLAYKTTCFLTVRVQVPKYKSK